MILKSILSKPLRLPWLVWLLLFGWLAYSLGLSDDEAYYWKLAQSPSLGYAFHPPAVGWMIYLFQFVLHDLFSLELSPLMVRLPALCVGALLIQQVSSWLRSLGADPVRATSAGWVMFAFAGVFGAIWMMVPDVPMLLGWLILFRSTWSWTQQKKTNRALLGIVLGTFIAIQSKYTGILFWGSALLAVLAESRGGFLKNKAFWALILGLLAAALPIVLWNIAYDWGPLQYQMSERHTGFRFSLSRGLRFWFLQLVLAGPLVFYAFKWFFKVRIHKVPFYLSLWFWPPFLVFCFQPWFSDFKFHWSLTAWLPVSILMAWRSCSQMDQGWLKAQRRYASVLLSLVWILMQWPVAGWIGMRWMGEGLENTKWQPKWDVSNDYYGWGELLTEMKKDFAETDLQLPLTGSRYQTASQVAFALKRPGTTVLVPRDLKQRDEWPRIDAFEYIENQWPILKSPVLYFADDRYSAGPEFKNSDCKLIKTYSFDRHGVQAKSIQVYRCQPSVI